MLNYLKYHYYRLKNPEFTEYVDQGLGIEARFKRCKKFWDKHISFTKAVQALALSNACGKRAAVLGAGRLFDVNLDELKKCSSVAFYDADPSCVLKWKKSALKQTEFFIGDLTETLEDWGDLLEDFLASSPVNSNKLADFLSKLTAPQVKLMGGQYSCIISVNLLSQIIVFWRDLASDLIEKHNWAETDERGCFTNEIQKGLEASKRELERQHFEMLNQSGASNIALIFDTHFYAYEKNIAEWDDEMAVLSDPEVTLTNYKLNNFDSWLWHIAPQGIEYDEYGLIHEVVGYYFEQK